jgi:hypothetical protein
MTIWMVLVISRKKRRPLLSRANRQARFEFLSYGVYFIILGPRRDCSCFRLDSIGCQAIERHWPDQKEG